MKIDEGDRVAAELMLTRLQLSIARQQVLELRAQWATHEREQERIRTTMLQAELQEHVRVALERAGAPQGAALDVRSGEITTGDDGTPVVMASPVPEA